MVRHTAIISLIPLVIFLWEHIALTNNISVKPSVFIDGLTLMSEIMWKIIGVGFAYLGTHYEYYHLDKVYDTYLSLHSSFIGLIKSIQYFELGFDSVANLYKHPSSSEYNSELMIYACAFLTSVIIITTFLWFRQQLYHRLICNNKTS